MPANVSVAMDNSRQQARSDVTTEAWKESTVKRSDAAQQPQHPSGLRSFQASFSSAVLPW